jgi:tripartite ATP-independent transporter DctM subunit
MIWDAGAVLALGMFVAACAALMAGYPVAFTLAGVALVFALIGFGLQFVFATPIPLDTGYLGLLPERIFGTMLNDTLLAIPLFVVMGVLLERSKIAEDLLDAMGQLLSNVRGGLAISVSIVGALLAASTGIVGATVVTMGLISLPTMLRRGYSSGLACGSIAAAGTLGQIIPPSIVLVLLGDTLSSAYQQAQRSLGIVNTKSLTVGDLFAGALLPGLCLVGLYISYQIVIALIRPDMAPGLSAAERADRPSMARLLAAVAPTLILILSVLGSILTGIASPTEAAGVGAFGALLMGAYRIATQGRIWILAGGGALLGVLLLANLVDLRWPAGDLSNFSPVIGLALLLCLAAALSAIVALIILARAHILAPTLRSAMLISTMVFTILIGAALFSLVFRGLGGDAAVHHLLSEMPGGVTGAMIIVMLVMFVLGFFLDFIEIVFVVVPIVAPVLLKMGVDPIWLGVMMAMNLQTSFLTPPFGFALFYLRGVAPPSVTTGEIYRGVIPFVMLQLLMLAILSAFPQLATWLPNVVFG